MLQKKLRRTGAVLLAACMMFGSVPVTAFHAHAADTPSSVVSGITGATLNEEGTAIAMPTVPEGMSIRFCADYEQVISEEGEVYQPLEDKTVKGFFEVSSGEGDSKNTAKTGEFSVNVRGTYHGDNGGNPKPEVIPELQEWHGESGMFLLRPTAQIVADADLKDTAEIFAADLKDITGKELPVVTGTEADIEKGDFYLTLNTEDEGLGDEGYLMTVGDSVKIEAKKAVGAYWGTVSVLQILKQTKNHIAKGVARV